MGKDILHRVGNGGHCGCETVSREVLPQVEIPEKWTQEPPCLAITIWCAIKIAHQNICKFWSLIKTHHLLVCNIINMMPYNGCSQMLHISLKTEKSFIAHLWRLLCVVGLEEYSAHDWRAATSGTARSSYLARVGPVCQTTSPWESYFCASFPSCELWESALFVIAHEKWFLTR